MPLALHIDSYSFGRIEIDGREYKKDLLICQGGVRDKWWRKEGHSLFPEDIEAYLDPLPEVLIIGCGSPGRLKVPDATRQWIAGKGIRLIEIPTAEACDRYNELAGTATVIAGMHLTC